MPQRPLVALIALDDGKIPSEADLAAVLQRQWPGEPPVERVERRDGGLSFFWGEDKVVITYSPEPIPWPDLEGPCGAAWYWPEAAIVLRGHRAHLLVLLQPKGVDRLAAALKLTRVTAAVAECGQSMGIFWGGGGLVHAPEPFISTAREMDGSTMPLQLWIGFRLLQNADGSRSMYTDGLEEFGQPEMEVHHTHRNPQILFDRMLSVVHYVLEKGVPFKENETFGFSDDERIDVRYGPSTCDPTATVVILDL